MADITFFIVSYDAPAEENVAEVERQLSEAMAGKRAVVLVPDGIYVEQFTVGRPEEWE